MAVVVGYSAGYLANPEGGFHPTSGLITLTVWDQSGERQSMVRAVRPRGPRAPRPVGGDQRPYRIEDHADLILSVHERQLF